MSAYQSPIPTRLCEFLKLMRTQRLSAQQLSDALGWNQSTGQDWVREFEANGILVDCGTARVGKRGKASRIYTLSREWGGTVTVDELQVVAIERELVAEATE